MSAKSYIAQLQVVKEFTVHILSSKNIAFLHMHTHFKLLVLFLCMHAQFARLRKFVRIYAAEAMVHVANHIISWLHTIKRLFYMYTSCKQVDVYMHNKYIVNLKSKGLTHEMMLMYEEYNFDDKLH